MGVFVTKRLMSSGNSQRACIQAPYLIVNGVGFGPALRILRPNRNATDALSSIAPNLYGVGDFVSAGSGTNTSITWHSLAKFTVPYTHGRGTNQKYFEAGSVGDYAITTEDIAIETALQARTSGVYIDKRGADTKGWSLKGNTGPVFQFVLSDGTNTATISSSTLTSGTYYHIFILVDRSGFGQIFINGAASGVAVDVSAVGAIDNTSMKMTIGNRSGGGATLSSGFDFLNLWYANAMLDTHDHADIALDRYTKIAGP